jgi:hypothetical protein
MLEAGVSPTAPAERQEQAMQHNQEKPDDATGVTLVTGMLLFAVALCSLAFAQHVGTSSPTVGDIIVFGPGGHAEVTAADPVVAQVATGNAPAQPGRICLLQTRTMLADGGSMVVEATEGPSSGYLVHWAGGLTSPGATDCGRDASLFIGKTDLRALAAAARSAVAPKADAVSAAID